MLKVLSCVKEIEEMMPEAAKDILRLLKIDRAAEFFYGRFCGKYDIELVFQRKWAGEFTHNKSKALEYWQRYRYLNEIKDICGIRGDSRVLDVGCGVSTVLHYIEGRGFGIDPLAEEYLKIYRYPEGMSIARGFAEDINFPSGHFDIVFCSSVLDHLADRGAAISEIDRVLKKGGYFVLTVEVFKSKPRAELSHLHSLTKNEVYSLLEDRFEAVFEGESPWIGLRDYVRGSRKWRNKELILVLRKVRPLL